jgi:hypothetical protein
MVLDQEREEPLDGAVEGAVHHVGSVRPVALSHVGQVEPLRQVEVELDG